MFRRVLGTWLCSSSEIITCMRRNEFVNKLLHGLYASPFLSVPFSTCEKSNTCPLQQTWKWGSAQSMCVDAAQHHNPLDYTRLFLIVMLEAVEKKWTCTPNFWAGPPWPTTHPLNPLPVPPPRQKGYQSALFSLGTHLHTHQDLKLKCCRVMGQKLRYRRPCTCDLPGTHNWLAQSHIASISSEFHWLFHAGTIL